MVHATCVTVVSSVWVLFVSSVSLMTSSGSAVATTVELRRRRCLCRRASTVTVVAAPARRSPEQVATASPLETTQVKPCEASTESSVTPTVGRSNRITAWLPSAASASCEPALVTVTV